VSLYSLLRDVHTGSRLAIGGAVFIIAYVIGPADWPPALRGEIAWVAAVAVLLALTFMAISGATPEDLRARARKEDESGWAITAIILVAAVVSLGALGFVLSKSDKIHESIELRASVAILSVAASWLLTQTTFAFRYAHHYYGDPEGPEVLRGGLIFPNEPAPDYWDFFYFSFVVGMTCQVSDVQVSSHSMRRLTLGHGVLAFFFNTGVLALAVNILASTL
jgi:uncharacterized membrane protein